jgi:ubiquinone/menaquinone biosynthesis C-methylase UbiE
MEGRWNQGMAWLYDAVVAAGIGDLYDEAVDTLFSNVPERSRILDVGCGSGQIAIRAARKNPQAFVLGLDLSPGQIARANSRSLGVSNVSFGVVDATSLPLADGSFDFVVSAAMIKHLPDRRQGLDQMRRVCREGGSVCVIEVDRDLTWRDTKAFVGRWKRVFPGTRPFLYVYFRRFVAGQGVSEMELSSLFGDVGFTSIEVQKVPGHPLLAGLGIK